MKPIWKDTEDQLILKLRKKNIPYKEIVELLPERTQDAIRNRFYVLTKEQNNSWLKEETLAFLDIETSGFNANFDFMLSWSLKYLDGELKHDVIKKSDLNSYKFDNRILQSLLREVQNVDVLVGYYSSKFDLPFFRTRCLMQNLDFPAYGSIKHIDLYYSVKYKMKLARNTLEQATTALGIEGKNHVLGKEWMEARLGKKEALDYVLEHNDLDVIILEDLYKRLLPYSKFNRNSI